jgi:sulfur transfer protein SufE
VSQHSVIQQLKNARGWEARQRILLAQNASHCAWSAAEREQAIAVTGCESATWLRMKKQGNQFYFELDSEARIVLGLGAVVLALVNDKTAAQIARVDFTAEFNALNISGQLSPSRNNGLFAIIKTVLQLSQCE